MPTVGRIVHFQTLGSAGGEHPSEPIAAIITAVRHNHPISGVPYVDLFAIYSNGTSHKDAVPWSDVPTPGHWNWPPRNDS